MGIFLVISGFLLANFRRGQRSDVLRAAANALVADVRRMQTGALAGGIAGDGAVGYGLHVDLAHPNRYVLFGDRSHDPDGANGRYDVGEEVPGGIVTLPGNTIITAVAPSAATNDILFTAPRGLVTIMPVISGATEATVTLRARDGGSEQHVTINAISGQVSVE